jgi:ankyrin repeat protein
MATEDAYRLIQVCFNSLEQAAILLESEPSLLTERTGTGETPLHYLAVENQLEAVQFLFLRVLM